MSERPEAIRKYIAPSPSPVIVRRTKVLNARLRGRRAATAPARGRRAARRPGPCGRPGPVDDDHLLRDAGDDGEVLLDEQHRRELGRALERRGDLGHEQRREPLRRLVDEQHRVVVQERPGDRDHLLLAAGERARLLRAALLSSGKSS